MKIKLLLILSLLLTANLFAQTDGDVRVEELFLARDDGNGKAGEITENFFTNDIPIHCIVQLDSLKIVTVKMIFVALKVNGVKPETKVITTKYTTNGEQNQISFTGKPHKEWVAGTYRIDIYLNEKLTKNLEFEIKKTPQQITIEKQPQAKPKNGAVRKLKKN